MTEKSWDRIIDIHLKGVSNTTREAAKYMKEKNSGRVTNVTSTAGLYGIIGQITTARQNPES